MSDLAALQAERAGYVVRGLADRVKAVDAAIKALGADPAPAVVEVPQALPPQAIWYKTPQLLRMKA